jgi:hypothetical protein
MEYVRERYPGRFSKIASEGPTQTSFRIRMNGRRVQISYERIEDNTEIMAIDELGNEPEPPSTPVPFVYLQTMRDRAGAIVGGDIITSLIGKSNAPNRQMLHEVDQYLTGRGPDAEILGL